MESFKRNEEKTSIKSLLIMILISMWVIGVLLLYTLNNAVEVYGSVDVSNSYGALEVTIEQDYDKPVPVMIENGYGNPVPVSEQGY